MLKFFTLQKTCDKLRTDTRHFYWYCDQNFCIHRVARILKLWEVRLLEDGFIILYIMQSEYGLHHLVRGKSDVRSYNNLHVIVLQDNLLPDLIKHISIGAGEWSWKCIDFKNKLAVESDFLIVFILTITVWNVGVNFHFLHNIHSGHILLFTVW